MTKKRARGSEGERRVELHKVLGGTTTRKRKLWQRQLARGRREGWYDKTIVGEIDAMIPADGRGVLVEIRTGRGVLAVPAAGLVDRTSSRSAALRWSMPHRTRRPRTRGPVATDRDELTTTGNGERFPRASRSVLLRGASRAAPTECSEVER